ncbi:unnamed protein product [Cuscuta epithymum]|uniref:Transposase MuDR plant domain-containing protein n=1 Tax=Cuscuta epithymum TaxID=186058 RepID=A0AAV0C4T2_9ASTE|nr:unnamed protein product [Cuscuta epithymum]
MTEYVNLLIHHGGKWDCAKRKQEYLGGEVTKKEKVDIDYISKFELHGFAKDLGYQDGVQIWFRRLSIKDVSGSVGLQKIVCDKDVHEMLLDNIMDPYIELYFVSKKSTKGKGKEKLTGGPSIPSQSTDAAHTQSQSADPTPTSTPAQTLQPVIGVESAHTPINSQTEEVIPTFLQLQFHTNSEDEEYLQSRSVSESSSEEQSVSHISEASWLYADLEWSEDEVFQDVISEDEQLQLQKHVDQVNEEPVNDQEDLDDLQEFNEQVAYSEDLHSYNGSENVDGNVPEFNSDIGSKHPDLCKGMRFTSHVECRKALKEWAVKGAFDYTYVNNRRSNITVVCKNKETCSFRIHASKMSDPGYFQIKTFKPKHECSFSNRNSLVTSTYLSEKYLDELRENPNWDVGAMQKIIQRQLRVHVSLAMCYRARVKAKAKIVDDIAD